MRTDRFEIALRIVVDDPIPALPIALQRGATGKGTLIPPVSRSTEAIVFDLEAIVDGGLRDGRPRLLGPFVQGPPEARFVYLVVGHPGTAGSGRTKVLLSDIDRETIEAVSPDDRLTAHIPSRSPKGGPALASVRPLPPGWIMA